VVAVGFGGGFGPVSKKPPPPVDGKVICGATSVERWLTELVIFATGIGFGCCCGCVGGGEVDDVKFKPLNASSKPVIFEGWWVGGDCRPPNGSFCA